jgi:transposase InsO family protein
MSAHIRAPVGLFSNCAKRSASEQRYQYLLHDRDSIFATHLDASVRRLAIAVVKSAPRCRKANAICERVIGTVRRECLDWQIRLSESGLRSILRIWVTHYNAGRPHMALGSQRSRSGACRTRFSADCTTNTSSRLPWLDYIFADYRP